MEIVKITKDDLIKSESKILNVDQLQMLIGKTPQQFKHKRPAKGGGQWDYVSGGYVQKVLNIVFGWDWDFTIIDSKVMLEAKQIIVQGRLTVRAGDRQIIKEQFGKADIKFKKESKDPLDLGNDFKGAGTDALKKCASLLGIASDVYSKQEFKEVHIIDELPVPELDEVVKGLRNGISIDQMRKKYNISKEMEEKANERV